MLCTITLIYLKESANFGGIEIGSKGDKTTVLDVATIKRGNYAVKSFWTENIGIEKGIAKHGNLAKEDIDKAVATVIANYSKMLYDFEIADENIFIFGSSGIAVAKNTQILADKIYWTTTKS